MNLGSKTRNPPVSVPIKTTYECWVNTPKSPSEHPNPHKLTKMGGTPTPKWDPIGVDPQPYVGASFFCFRDHLMPVWLVYRGTARKPQGNSQFGDPPKERHTRVLGKGARWISWGFLSTNYLGVSPAFIVTMNSIIPKALAERMASYTLAC